MLKLLISFQLLTNSQIISKNTNKSLKFNSSTKIKMQSLMNYMLKLHKIFKHFKIMGALFGKKKA